MWYEVSKLYIKKYVIRTIVVTAILLFIGNMVISMNPYNEFDKDYGVSVYFSLMSINRNVIYFISYALLLPSIILMDYYDYAANKFNYLMYERVGVKKYYKNSLINIFIVTFLATLFINLCLLVSVGLIWSNISFVPQNIYTLFSEDTFTNLFVYFILSSIGTGFFSMFMFSIINFIKNKYVYRGIVAILTFSSVIFCTIIGPLLFPLSSLFENLTMFKTFVFSLIPCGLLTPGMIFENYGFLNFICSFIIYLICFIIFSKISEVMRRKNG